MNRGVEELEWDEVTNDELLGAIREVRVSAEIAAGRKRNYVVKREGLGSWVKWRDFIPDGVWRKMVSEALRPSRGMSHDLIERIMRLPISEVKLKHLCENAVDKLHSMGFSSAHVAKKGVYISMKDADTLISLIRRGRR
jgi:hypothetical protein